MAKLIWTIILSIYSLSVAATSDIGDTSTRPSIMFNLAYVNQPNTGVIESRVANLALESGLNKTDNLSSLGLGAGVYLPLARVNNFGLNATGFFEIIPERHVNLSRTSDNYRYNLQLKTNRTNLGVGLDVAYYLQQGWYGRAMLASGVTYFNIHGQMNSVNLPGSTPQAGQEIDHPGFTSAQPFAMFDITVGKELNQETGVYSFFNISMAKKDKQITLGGVSLTSSYAYLDVPRRWIKVGLGFTQKLNIL